MKKLVSILLALAMILAMATTAFADDASLTITSAADRIYNGYKLLNLTVSLKEGEHHTAHDGDHTDDCFNYAYTVNEKYLAILQDETFNYAGTSVWGTAGKPASANDVTEANILDYLSKQSSDTASDYGTLRNVADRLYHEIKDMNADEPNINDTANIEQGYWMFADVTNLTGKDDANSLVMLDTKGKSDITVTPKVSIPTVEKKVKDIEDSEDGSITDNPWHDSADHDIDEGVIPFKLTADAPSNASFYDTYQLIFHDTLSPGLTLNPDSIKVLMYESKYKADVDTDMNEGVDVTTYFKTTTGLSDGCTFEVSCDNVKAIPQMSLTSAFVVYYEATLNENAVIGAAGNPNEVYLEFSNNPYSAGTGKTEKDKVVVFTYQLKVNKTDSHGHALKGAGFTLSKKNVDGTFTAIGEELKGDDMTTFTWKGLDDGDYKLVETTVPEGYNKMEDVLFSISATHDETSDAPALKSLDGGMMGTGEMSTGTITKDIVNNTGTVLPETGAAGTFMLLSVSSMLVMVAVVFMVTRKKMSIYED